MFETNLNDGRFLPFEGAGAESTWQLGLPSSFRQFDYDTISDVVLHIRYTARQGGDLLGGKATEQLEELVSEASGAGLALLFSLKHDFPSEWQKFVAANPQTAVASAPFGASVKREHFPYFTQGREISIDAIQLHAVQADQMQSITPQGLDLGNLTTKLADEGVFDLSLVPDGTVLTPTQAADIFVVIKYTVGSA